MAVDDACIYVVFRSAVRAGHRVRVPGLALRLTLQFQEHVFRRDALPWRLGHPPMHASEGRFHALRQPLFHTLVQQARVPCKVKKYVLVKIYRY